MAQLFATQESSVSVIFAPFLPNIIELAKVRLTAERLISLLAKSVFQIIIASNRKNFEITQNFDKCLVHRQGFCVFIFLTT